ncbi:MAG: hypothetical protein RMJ53_06035, partial [Chitinophagales bacterium]|nr:hypothetical protein [Chitinophagales bacterium]
CSSFFNKNTVELSKRVFEYYQKKGHRIIDPLNVETKAFLNALEDEFISLKKLVPHLQKEL